jgi:uncharacterized protein YcfJ
MTTTEYDISHLDERHGCSAVLVAGWQALQSTGCAQLSQTERGAAIGAGAGAVVGGAVGAVYGSTARGAIIGAAVGGTAGAVIGHQMDRQAQELEEGAGRGPGGPCW